MKLEHFKKSNLQQSQNVFLVPPVSGGMPASRSAASTKKQTANQICHAQPSTPKTGAQAFRHRVAARGRNKLYCGSAVRNTNSLIVQCYHFLIVS